MYKLILTETAQAQLREIALYCRELAGEETATKIVRVIHKKLAQLQSFPLSWPAILDKEMRSKHCRCILADQYVCIYQVGMDTIYVHHIAHAASDYPKLFKEIP